MSSGLSVAQWCCWLKVHAVSLMAPDVMCRHAAHYSPTSQSRHSDCCVFILSSLRIVGALLVKLTHRNTFVLDKVATGHGLDCDILKTISMKEGEPYC